MKLSIDWCKTASLSCSSHWTKSPSITHTAGAWLSVSGSHLLHVYETLLVHSGHCVVVRNICNKQKPTDIRSPTWIRSSSAKMIHGRQAHGQKGQMSTQNNSIRSTGCHLSSNPQPSNRVPPQRKEMVSLPIFVLLVLLLTLEGDLSHLSGTGRNPASSTQTQNGK